MKTFNYESQIMRAFSAFDTIRSVTSSKAKASILEENKDNFVLKSMLYLTYNPFLTYNVKKLPKVKPETNSSHNYSSNFVEFVNLLTKLSERTVTGNKALDEIKSLFSRLTEQEQLWYGKVIQKDLKIGLAAKGINRVFKKLIPEYSVLLANKIEAEDLNLDTPRAMKILPERMVTQYKIDGYRLNVFVYEGRVEVRTRNGKVVEGYNDLEREAIEKLPCGYVYDGEMTSPELDNWIQSNIDSNGEVGPDRSLFAEAMSHAFSKEEDKKGVFRLFDMIKITEWKTEEFKETLETRYNRIQEKLSSIEFENIRIVPTSRVYYKANREDLDEIVENFHRFIEIGWEGIMIKNLDAPYSFKRTNDLLKMKLMLSDDLEVLRLEEGEKGSKYEGTMGAAVVNYKASDGNYYELNVGSGWSDEERVRYWNNPNELVGKLLEVKYQSETQNKDGGYSVSFPVKVVVRADK